MSRLSDAMLIKLRDEEHVKVLRETGSAAEADAASLRAVADAAVAAEREGVPPGAGVWQVYDDSGNYGVLPTLAMCQLEFPGKLYRWVPAPPAAPAIPQGWQPIETAPKDGTDVIVMYRHIDTQVVHNAYFCAPDEFVDAEDVGWWSYHKIEVSRIKLDDWMSPTHWMPLPAAPKPQQECCHRTIPVVDGKAMRCDGCPHDLPR